MTDLKNAGQLQGSETAQEKVRFLTDSDKEKLQNWRMIEPQFYGTTRYFKHNLNSNVLYTDGIREMCQTLGCYWLLDIVASYIKRDFWVGTTTGRYIAELKVFNDDSWRFTIPGTEIKQEGKYTDMVLNEVIWYLGYGEHGTTIICLPSED